MVTADMSRSMRWAVALVVVAFVILVQATSAWAQSAAVAAAQGAEPTLELEVIGAIPNGPGVTVPIEVTVVSPRAARGTLEVRMLGLRTATTVNVPIDVPANTPVRLPLAVPSSYDGVNIMATIALDGVPTVNQTLQQWGGEQPATVGLIGVDSPGETVGLGIDGGSAVVLELDDASIRNAGLGQVGTLVVSPGGLRGLSAETQELVLGWLGSGGDAVIVGPPGSIDDMLPAQWRDARPGVGRISYAESDWASTLVPSAATSGSIRHGSPEFVFGDAAFDLNLNGIAELAVDAGLGLLGARTLLIFLGIYAVIAGPIAYLVLKRIGRRNLAWAALPALALAFTVAAVVVGAGIRSDRNDSHATIVEVQPTGSTARSALLLTSTFRGERTVELPAGWNMVAAGDLGGNGSSAPIALQPDRDRMRVTMDLDAGGAGVATFEGGAPMFDDALRISDVTADRGATISGQVTNNTDAVLTDVLAFAGAGVAEVGSVEAGQSVEFRVEFAPPFGANRRGGRSEFEFWPAPRWGERPREDSSVGVSTWGQWRVLEGYNTFAPGTVGIVGWSDQFDSPAVDVENGRTGLVARAALPSAIDSQAAIDHIVVSSPNNSIIENANFFGQQFTSRVDVSAAGDDYVAILGGGVAGAEVWIDGWQWIELDGRDEVAVTLPSEAFVDGTAWLRTSVPEWSWPPTPGLAIASVAPGEEATKAVLGSGAIEYRNVDEGFGGRFGPAPFPEPVDDSRGISDIEELIPLEVVAGESLTVEGELFGDEIDTYVIELEAGERIGVQVRSRQHDSYLTIRDESGGRLAEDDDSGRDVDSELVFNAPIAGSYLIEASSLGAGRGGYEIVVERGE